jgi:glycosyltransferase involved in cell wall biosynthesis
MKLTVLNIAYPFAAAGPDAVGGAEQILSLLDQALVRAGHRSIVVAAEGSQTCGTLIPTSQPHGTLSDDVKRRVQRQHRRNIERAMELYDIDLIHLHGIDFNAYLPPPGPPALVTLHLPPAWYEPEVFALSRPRTYLHCVSRSQRRACPESADLIEEIPNGVPVEALGFACTKRNYAVALGRICPEKNAHVALDAARAADIGLLLGGQVFPYEAHRRYFDEQIVPRLDSRRRFLGPIGFARKRRLLAGARCLLHPTLAAETSSLVAMEALACGTPVIAFRSGALSDIIEDGVTGFLVSDEREMANRIADTGRIDPQICRETARRRFSLQAMTKKYFAVYERLVAAPAWATVPLESASEFVHWI